MKDNFQKYGVDIYPGVQYREMMQNFMKTMDLF